MRIRTKTTGLQLLTILTILLSIFVLFRSLREIEKLKEVQVEFSRFIDIETELQDILKNSLYTNEHIVDYQEKLSEKYLTLIDLINSFYFTIEEEYEEINTNFKNFYYKWYALDANYYQKVTNDFRSFADKDSGWIPIISNYGLLNGYNILNHDKENGLEDIEKLEHITRTIHLINKYHGVDDELMELMNVVQRDLGYEMQKNIAWNALIIVIFIVFVVTLSLYMSSRVAKEVISKTKNVGKSIQKLSEGELSIQITDKNADEFSEVTDSINTLTNMLVTRATSMKEIMDEISSSISESMNLETLYLKILQMSKETTNADSAAILMVDKFSDTLRVEHVDGFFPPPYTIATSVQSKRSLIEEKFKATPIHFNSCYLTQESVLKGDSLFIKDTELDKTKLPLHSNPQDILFIKSSITVPLVVSNKLFGVLTLAKTGREETFSDLDFTNMVSYGEYVSLTIDNIYRYMELLEKSEMQREMNIASEIQERLLPKKIPVIPNVDISAFSDSARGISGDYYDIYKISKTKSVATVCDVAGKGIAAALVLVIIRTILQLASHSKSTAKDLLTFLNRSISDRVKTDYFATLSIIVYDDETNTVTLSIAGDTPILIYRDKEKIVERIYHGEVPVGIDTSTQYVNIEFELNEDDVLYLFSDGLLEVQNEFNDTFSIDELESFILENSNNRTETITVLLRNYLSEFRGEKSRLDDETVIVFRKI